MSHQKHILFAAAVLLAAATSLACNDSMVRPNPSTPRAADPEPRRSGFTEDTNYGQYDSPASGSYDGSIDPWDASAAPGLMATFHFPTIISVAISGSVTQVPGALHGDDLVWGPAGTSDHQTALALTNGAGYVFPSAIGASTVYIQGGTGPSNRSE